MANFWSVPRGTNRRTHGTPTGSERPPAAALSFKVPPPKLRMSRGLSEGDGSVTCLWQQRLQCLRRFP
eukprot:2205707-Rhodomonas_salina.1